LKAIHKPVEVDVMEIPFDCTILFQGENIPVRKGDVIVSNALGESYPMSRDSFNANYDIVKE
jgi:hypothetical protein